MYVILYTLWFLGTVIISQCKITSNLISNYKIISYKTINMLLSVLPHFKNQNIVKVIVLQVYIYSLNTKIGVIVKQIWDIHGRWQDFSEIPWDMDENYSKCFFYTNFFFVTLYVFQIKALYKREYVYFVFIVTRLIWLWDNDVL